VTPQLGETVGAEANSIRSACGIVEINSTRTACPIRIKLNSVLAETDAVTASGIDVTVVRAALRTAEIKTIRPWIHARKLATVKHRLAPLKNFSVAISVRVFPQDTIPQR